MTATLREYKDDLGHIAENLAHPDIALEVSATAQRHGKRNGDIYRDLQAAYPIHWHRAKGQRHGRQSLTESLRRIGRVTEDSVRAIKAVSYKYRKIIPEGQLIVIVGPANAGKTAVLEHICAQIEGEVLYLNMDIASAHIPDAYRRAEAGGYELICPDLYDEGGIPAVAKSLERYARAAADLSDLTLVIDTLKKLTDMLDKRAVSRLLKTLRALTAHGATVICLAHTNKYEVGEGKDKWPIYEGTVDLRNDCDAMAALIPYVGDYGVITTSLYWGEQGWPSGKDRGEVEPASWEIDKHDGRAVRELDEWTDTQALVREASEVRKYSDLVRDIYSYLHGTPGGAIQSEVLRAMKQREHAQRQVRKCLGRFEGEYWQAVQESTHNARRYTAIKGAALPK
jgi:KaiC/GvpD/RAD55 family RecA-like ATPase